MLLLLLLALFVRRSILGLVLLLVVVTTAVHSEPRPSRQTTPQQGGDVSAVYDLLDRVLWTPHNNDNHIIESPSSHFVLQLCNDKSKDNQERSGLCRCEAQKTDGWFCMEQQQQQQQQQHATPQNNNNEPKRILVMASSISELSYGIGYYLRYHCNVTLGWDRICGSVRNVTLPAAEWPVLPEPLQKRRTVPWSYLMNVCTHSYSLVWYDWNQWEAFLDWASLMGINNLLALTGQEEIQYKVYQKLGLTDTDIRSWFNGPAFLTWSRGQNEYGSNIAGPLPRSWMQQQWTMQREHILPRLKELNIVGQLPGFQGNVPIQLANLYPDSKMTKMEDTGWLDSLDPLYGKIADLWMSTMLEDFGKDVVSHWYQMDGYFNGGVPPWFAAEETNSVGDITGIDDDTALLVSTSTNRRLESRMEGISKDTETPRDEVWYQRGVAAFTGLNRTDPLAVWSFQGFAFIGWNNSDITASWLKGFVDSVPPGRFVIIDMAFSGLGEWTKWNNASYFGADFIWSALHNFGDTSGLKGDMARIASIVPSVQSTTSSMMGIGGTPEGIDQNPAYYEFLFDQAFASSDESSIPNVARYLIERAHRRYGGVSLSDGAHEHVTKAWHLLAKSSYAADQSVQDYTGVAHRTPRGGDSSSQFETDRSTPKPLLCRVHGAWRHLIRAAEVAVEPALGFTRAPFTYDLINTGREVLAQLSAPMAMNFSDALADVPLSSQRLLETGNAYIQLLNNLELLLGSQSAFLVGPWIESAREWGEVGSDCHATAAPVVADCPHFYEWNARVQITTWNPTMPDASSVPGGPIDYAAKHWSGLIGGYYAKRVELVLRQALADAGASGTLNATSVDRLEAEHAYHWTTSREVHPTRGTGDPLQLSKAMEDTYRGWFDSCLLEV